MLLPCALLLTAAEAAAAALPCDIYAAAGTPCVAAHSVARALFATYTGPLYTVHRGSDGSVKAIGLIDGVVDTAAVTAFCSGQNELCTVQQIFDQSPKGNHLAAGASARGLLPVNATRQQFRIGAGSTRETGGGAALAGKPFYAAVFEGKMGYRNDTASGVAVGDEPESIYMVVSGKHYNDQWYDTRPLFVLGVCEGGEGEGGGAGRKQESTRSHNLTLFSFDCLVVSPSPPVPCTAAAAAPSLGPPSPRSSCFDYGNAETNIKDDGTGSMEASLHAATPILPRISSRGH